MKNEIIEIDGQRWKVREAVSRQAAMEAIVKARCSGCVGGRDVLDQTACGGAVTVLADVVQINSDGTERQPYTKSY